MRIIILGSGVIGVCSAWYLARAGHEVTVIDRQSESARETSGANAGQISPGYASPWAAPGVPLKALKWLFMKYAPLSIRPGIDPHQYVWLWQMLRNCTASRYAVNKARMVRLSEYSRDCLDELRKETGLDYEDRQLGTTQLFRTPAQLDGAAKDIAVFDQRVRIGGMAGVSGFDLSLRSRGRETLEKVITDLYPHAGDLSRATFWTGLRPATPDGTPVIGATRLHNLYLNTGHGTLGWTMACGSGRYLADLLADKTPQISTEGLDISRYRKPWPTAASLEASA